MDPRDRLERAGEPEPEADLDEVAARRARDCYHDAGPVALPVDEDVAALLRPDEPVLARHETDEARFDGVPSAAVGPATAAVLVGTLVLTSHRILLVGEAATWSVDLADIEEAVVSGRRLLLVLPAGIGLAVTLERPRLLRVQIAAARTACGDGQGRSAGVPGDGTGRGTGGQESR